MVMIFIFSSKTGTSSAGMSIGYAQGLAKFLGWLGVFHFTSTGDLLLHAEKVHTFVRKAAHFMEYAVLGFFSYQAIVCDIQQGKKAILAAQILCSCYAGTDEFHQVLVPGREGKAEDVIIDSMGALVGILCSFFFYELFKNINKYKNGSKKYPS